MINDNKKDELLESSTAPRVTKEQMEERINHTEFTRIGGTVTICSITLDNGFSVRGESACVSVENYNQMLGEKISYDNAFNNLWAFFGFLLAEETFKALESDSE